MTKSTFAVALLVTLAASACSSSFDSTGSGQAELGKGGSDPVPVPPKDPSDPSSTDEWCFDAMVSASACTSISDLYAKATANCGASNGVIKTFDVGLGCPKGDGQDAKYRCCSAPPPPPPCFTVDIGDAKACRGDSDMETLGQQECGAKKAKMTKMAPDYACPNASIGGMSHFAKIECCTQ